MLQAPLLLLLRGSLRQPWQTLAALLVLTVLALWQASRVQLDAVPDITNVQVQINTSAPGYSPLETEQRLSMPLERAMAGLPKLSYTRSLSRYGLSQVTVVFSEGTDIYWARQQVSERLAQARSQLPAALEPQLGPVVSGLGEIFSYTVKATGNKADGTPYSLAELRAIQDWQIKPQLMTVPGVTEINTIGGIVPEYQVAPDLARLLALKLTLDDLASALERNNSNVGAGYIERNGEQWLIRSPGQLQSLADIANLVVAKRDDGPVRVCDVATVQLGAQLRSGAATQNGEEVVLGTVMMLLGENSRQVAQAVATRLDTINSRLPAGVTTEISYNREDLIDKTIRTVSKNLLEGAVLVTVILFLFLGNIRAALITAMVIPLSMLFALTGMAANRVSGNLMSLGAIDFGLIVDGAVIVSENCLRRLAEAQQQHGRLLLLRERLQLVRRASLEVLQPAVFGVLIIMLVYLPLFALSGVEGKMFRPMAFTVVMALLGALLLTLTLVPVAIALWVKGPVSHQDNRLMALLRRLYQPVLDAVLRHSRLSLLGAVLLIGLAALQGRQLGSEFLPELNEGDIALHAMRIPGTALSQSVAMQQQLEQEIARLPEVLRVFSKIGTPDIATDPMPPNVADTIVMLKPVSQWPDPAKTQAQLVEDIRSRVNRLAGNNFEFTQPIQMRFNELIAGVRADVAVRLYGDDLAQLSQSGNQLLQIIQRLPGAADARLEQADGLPLLSIEPERDHLALLNIDVASLQQSIQTAVGGRSVGVVYQGDRPIQLVLRLAGHERRDPQTLAQMPVLLPASGEQELNYVPLGEIARIRELTGPNQINRQNGKRHVVLSVNVQDRDLGSFVNDLQQQLAGSRLPDGYWLEIGGTYEQLQSAQQRLQWVVPLTLLLIFLLLCSALKSLRDAALVFSGIPLALVGGVLALSLRDMPLSISAAVGFIALSGIAVLNGIVLTSAIRSLQHSGHDLSSAIRLGAQSRLRPVLMTALVASLGFIPMAFNTGTGAEVQRPLATVVIGGVLSSTLLTLLVLPALLNQFSKTTRCNANRFASNLTGSADHNGIR